MASTEMVIRDRAKEITLPASGICPGAGFIDSTMVPWVPLVVIMKLNKSARATDSYA